jgi:hypothetical protein
MKKISLTPFNTYCSEANAEKAAVAVFGATDLRYFINRTVDGRFHPVFVGQSAVQAGAHFKFVVVG